MCKTLKQEEISKEKMEELIIKANKWVEEAQEEIDFVRPLFNLCVEKHMCEQFTQVFYSICKKKETILQDNSSLLKAIFNKITTTTLIEKWSEQLEENKNKIEAKTILKMIEEKTRKGKTSEKQKWEIFQEKYTTAETISQTREQTCVITSRVKYTENNTAPKRIIVWNGNGVRARWNKGESELKRLVRAAQPDILCFLEAKIDAERLFDLQGFKEWTKEQKYEQVFCYWSECEEKVRRGCEGIMILSKIKCNITTGMNNPEFDKQARVITLEFEEIFIIVSYHPQGGFTINSQQHRKEWEKQFTAYLKTIRKKAKEHGRL